MTRVMVLKGGAPALHKLGNISRTDDEFIDVKEETETEYIGNFSEGFGYIDVRFDKKDCRPITKEEVDSLNKKVFTINNKVYGRICVDDEGNYLPVKTEEK